MKRVLKVLIPALLLPLLAVNSVQADRPAITVGGKNFTEQFILAEMAKILLEEHGFAVNLRTGVGSIIARRSLANGQIDVYYEYTGTAYTVYYNRKDPSVMRNPVEVYNWVKDRDGRKGLVWLQPVDFNNTYTLMMRKRQAGALEVDSISRLADLVERQPEKLIFAVNTEFWERPDGFKEMMKHYGFRVPFDNIRKMSLGLTYKALKEGEVDVAMGFATDGRIKAFGFVSLTDDRNFFPIYNPAPVVRKEVLAEHPEISDILKPIAEHLTTEAIRTLNAAVDVQHRNEREVAREWLEKNGLL